MAVRQAFGPQAITPPAGLPAGAGPAIDPALLDLLRWRRDVRRFRRDALPEGTLAALVAAADLAPSVGLSQPWRFVAVEDPARRAAIRANYARCNAAALAAQSDERRARYAMLKLAGLDDAPCQLGVFVDEGVAQGHGLGRRTIPETLAWSAVIAVHTLWLAARSIGVGVGWVSILDPLEVARTLDVPPAWRFVAYLCIGRPDADADTPELERSGWERRRPSDILYR